MAMRGPRGNFTSIRPSATAIPPRRIHEKFSPNSEWKTEKEADVLLVFLPDFLKHNIKVTTEVGNILRITGERPVGVNKSSRFQEDFQIPRKCNIKAIRAKFEGGVLSITFPWTAASTSTDQKPKIAQPVPAASPPPPATQQNVKPTSQTTPTPTPTPTTIPPVVPALPTPEPKSPEKSSFQTVSTPKSPNVSNANLPQEPREFEEFSRPPLITDDKTPLIPTLGHGRGATSEEVLTKKDDVKNEMAEKKKGGEMYGNDLEKKLGIEKIEDIETKGREEKVAGDDQEAYKQVMKGLAWGINEEKELLVNMGAAVLVIVALGAYICYTFSSSKH